MAEGDSHEVMLREFFLGFSAVHVLHHAATGPVYGAAMMEELARHGYDLSPGTLYPMLHRLESHGLLTHEERTVGGRVRKYYRATAMGKRVLDSLRPKILELVSEVVRGVGPDALPEAGEEGPATGSP